MFIELFIAIIIGILLGAICGLIPGVHTNTISAIMVSTSPLLLQYLHPLTLAAAIASMGVSQEFLNCIPSIFLGAPDAETALSVLPGHRMLLDGRGNEAILITAAGCLLSLIVSILMFLPFAWLAEYAYPLVRPYIGWLVLAACIYLTLNDKDKLWTVIIFILSGLLGLATLNMNAKEPLLPLFSGLFGISMLLLSFNSSTKIPEQKPPKLSLKKSSLRPLALASLAGWLCAFMPGLGPSQAAALTGKLGDSKKENFLFMMGALCMSNFVISIITLYAIEKARSGAVVAISAIASSFGMNELLMLLAVCLASGGFAAMLAPRLAQGFSRVICKVNYSAVCIGTTVFIVILVAAVSRWQGMIILATATALGIVTNIRGIRKSAMMGCLLLPVIVWFLGG